jgi:hypothetical protein
MFGDALGKIGNFISKPVTNLIKGGVNTAGMAKDFIDYKMAKTPEQKRKEGESYARREKAAKDAFKAFGFDDDKKTRSKTSIGSAGRR